MRKVITYGTFDLFHRGHYNILKRAKEQGDYLIVGVTGESYDAERGKLSVRDSLATRIENVKKTGFADQIIVEEYLGQKINDIIKYDVDVLVIGSDWKGKFDHLNKYCEVKYLERTKSISSTQLREEMTTYKYGIVTDDLKDNDNITEPKYVSGIHVESVYSDNEEIAKKFCEKYELDKGYTNYEEFLDSVDIVYIKAAREKREKLVRQALESEKHVVCDVPISLKPEIAIELEKRAEEKGVVLLNNFTTNYLQAFSQLLWNARGNAIGDLVSMSCNISKGNFKDNSEMDFYDIAFYPVCAIVKIFGVNYEKTSCKLVKDDEGRILYGLLEMQYKNSVAVAEIGMDIEIPTGMKVLGTHGSIHVPDDWWRIGYFKIKRKSEKNFQRYCANFEGNGFRYLIQSMLSMIRTKKTSSQRITMEETKAINAVLNSIKM